MSEANRARGSFDLTGKTALVTGGNRGIGLAYARGLARHGADLILWGRDAQRNEQAAIELAKFGARVHTQLVDVAEEDAVIAAMAAARQFTGRLDCVIANAGVIDMAGSVLEIKGARWNDLLGVNLSGAFFTLREAARIMVEGARAGGTGGSLIACGSLSVFAGTRGLEHYAASKGGLASLVKTMAAELGRFDIRVNMIAPGFIKTDASLEGDAAVEIARRTPSRRLGKLEDLEGAAVYLASDASAFHNGDVLVIDGGWMAGLMR